MIRHKLEFEDLVIEAKEVLYDGEKLCNLTIVDKTNCVDLCAVCKWYQAEGIIASTLLSSAGESTMSEIDNEDGLSYFQTVFNLEPEGIIIP